MNIFNTALVTPTYYVYFTSCTLITSCILFRGIKGTTHTEIASIVLGFLQICAGSILLQLSKSAKDVPDAQVLTAKLGQLHVVAEQEEMESEPRADTIRGTAALIRSFSKARKRREAEEVQRIHEESLEPIGENEIAEWDGIRRRKSSVVPRPFPRRVSTLERVQSAEGEIYEEPKSIGEEEEDPNGYYHNDTKVPIVSGPTPPPHQLYRTHVTYAPTSINLPRIPRLSSFASQRSASGTSTHHDDDDTESHNPEDDVGILPRFPPQMRGGGLGGRPSNRGSGSGTSGGSVAMPSSAAEDTSRRQFSFSSVFTGRQARTARLTEEERLGLVSRDAGL